MPVCGDGMPWGSKLLTLVGQDAPSQLKPHLHAFKGIFNLLAETSGIMTWIKTGPTPETIEKLRENGKKMMGLYPPEYGGGEIASLKELASKENGGGITDSHMLMPDTLYHSFAAFGTMMSPELPLSRKQHEMIATTVSVINHCFY